MRNSCFRVTRKIRRLMSQHCIFLDNSESTNHYTFPWLGLNTVVLHFLKIFNFKNVYYSIFILILQKICKKILFGMDCLPFLREDTPSLFPSEII